MDAAKAQVLLDIGLLALGALALGLPLFALMRQRENSLGWHHHGNVWTAPYDRIDLAVACLLFGYFFINIAVPAATIAASPDTPAGEVPSEPEGVSEGGGPGLSKLGAALVGMVFFAGLGCGVFAYATVLRQRNPTQIFGLDRMRPWQIALWAIGAMVPTYLVMGGLALLWVHFFQPLWGGDDGDLQEVVKMIRDDPDPVLRLVLIFSAVIVAPFVEETLFRGFLYPVIKRYSDRFFAAVVTALLFATVHGTVPGLMPLFGLAIILTAAYEITGSLWVPIAIHATFNSIQTIGILVIGGHVG